MPSFVSKSVFMAGLHYKERKREKRRKKKKKKEQKGKKGNT